MNIVRIGIIGFGGMGSHHGRYLAAGEVPFAKLTAVCDIDPERLKLVKHLCGHEVQTFEDAESFFAARAVDAVLIATPHYFHPPLAIEAFNHGYHVMSEKPAGVYALQVREMNEAAKQSGKVFGLMFNQRTHVSHQKMRDIVASGELGEIRRVLYLMTEWFRTQAYYDSGGWRATWAGEGGGVLVNQCPHNLDLLQWVCGMPSRVRAHCAFGKFHDIEVEDAVSAYLEYPNGATGVFITTTGEAPGSNRFEIAGDRGKLVLENGKLIFHRTRVSVSQHLRESTEGFLQPETWTCELASGGGSEHQGIVRNWVQAILTGEPLIARGEEGINGVQLANAMLLSTWTDNWVDMPMDEEFFYQELQQRVRTSKVKTDRSGRVMNFAGTF